MSKTSVLPLIDDCLFIDNSTIETLDTCNRRFEYTFLRKRRLASEQAALRFGAGVHEALAYRYRTDHFFPTTDEPEQMQVLNRYFTDKPCVDEGYRNVVTASDLIRQYNKTYPTETFKIMVNPKTGKPIVEAAFCVPLTQVSLANHPRPIRIFYTGCIDLVTIQSNMTMITDHKTTSILGPQYFETHHMSSQFPGYMWALNEVLGVKPQGYIINVLCARTPTKTGKGFEFARQPYFRSWDVVDEWHTNLLYLLREALNNYEAGYFPMKKQWCVGKYGRCQFYNVCELPRQSREIVINSDMYKDDSWSPLKGKETI